jgi:hypothetical protein
MALPHPSVPQTALPACAVTTVAVSHRIRLVRLVLARPEHASSRFCAWTHSQDHTPHHQYPQDRRQPFLIARTLFVASAPTTFNHPDPCHSLCAKPAPALPTCRLRSGRTAAKPLPLRTHPSTRPVNRHRGRALARRLRHPPYDASCHPHAQNALSSAAAAVNTAEMCSPYGSVLGHRVPRGRLRGATTNSTRDRYRATDVAAR